jgi:hypothetical protein
MTLGKGIGIALAIVIVIVLLIQFDVLDSVTGLFRSGDGEKSPVSLREPLNVYVIRGGGTYYHRADCPELEGKAKVLRPLETARELYKPCPKCNPPE